LGNNLVGKLLLLSECEIINDWSFPGFSFVENSTTLMMRIDNLERSPLRGDNPVKSPRRAQIETIRGKKRWGHFCQHTPSVENVASILPSPPATAIKKERIPNSKNVGISVASSQTS
jgi:hypothetical protein